MQKCSSCGADLPENSRFCGNCGGGQDALATDAATTRGNTPLPPSWTPEGGTLPATQPPSSNVPMWGGSAPAWSPYGQAPATPPPLPPVADEDERRREGMSWSPLDGAALGADVLLGGAQVPAPGAPVIQGTPQINTVPSITGSPGPYTNAPGSANAPGSTNAPFGHPASGSITAPGSTNVPVSHPAPGSTNAPFGHPASGSITAPGSTNVPVSHPAPGSTNAPFGHPASGSITAPGSTNVPVSHPAPGSISGPGSTNVPVSHPAPNAPYQTGPQPTHYPSGQSGVQEPYPPHQHLPPRTHHMPHQAAGATKTVGGLTAKTLIIVVTAVVVAAGGVGAAVHFLTRPQPLINVTSSYKVGSTLAGSTGTTLHISGQKFSSNSTITLLLDGRVAPGQPGTHSDSNGNFSANITITDAWSVGVHTLTARDAGNYSTNNSVRVTIVPQGQANTPGPGGAPPDDASFQVSVQVQTGSLYGAQTEVVTGHPDPQGGTVCQPRDSGQPSVSTGSIANLGFPWQDTSTYSCTGSYKAGKLTLTEMLLSDVQTISQSDGTTATCTLNVSQPQINEQLSGSYVGNNTFSGIVTYPEIPDSDYSCVDDGAYNYYNFHAYEQDNWTGQVTDLH